MADERAAAGYDSKPPPPPPPVVVGSEGEPMTLAEWRAVSHERHRQIMRRLGWILAAAWIAAFGALAWGAYWWGLIPLRYAFLNENPLGL